MSTKVEQEVTNIKVRQWRLSKDLYPHKVWCGIQQTTKCVSAHHCAVLSLTSQFKNESKKQLLKSK